MSQAFDESSMTWKESSTSYVTAVDCCRRMDVEAGRKGAARMLKTSNHLRRNPLPKRLAKHNIFLQDVLNTEIGEWRLPS
jgi:hypothetical protein